MQPSRLITYHGYSDICPILIGSDKIEKEFAIYEYGNDPFANFFLHDLFAGECRIIKRYEYLEWTLRERVLRTQFSVPFRKHLLFLIRQDTS
jgi:hypothetical protein